MQEAVLAPYYRRIATRHGLSQNMKGKLTSYPVMIDMIRAAVDLLMEQERHTGMSGSIKVTRQQLYQLLIESRPDVVTTDANSGQRRERYPFHIFNEAMTVAKRVGLMEGWGRSGLSSHLLEQLRRAAQRGKAPVAS